MRVIPVLDLRDGVAVHAVAGQRASYRPVTLPGLADPRPLSLAQWYRARTGSDELYVADLDAIQFARPNYDSLSDLLGAGFRLVADLGIRSAADLGPIEAALAAPASQWEWVVGLESLADEAELARIRTSLAAGRPILSLDMAHGTPLTTVPAFCQSSAEELVTRAVDVGYSRVLLLDLKQVGTNRGTGTLELARRIRGQHPTLEWLAGGGVRGVADLHELAQAGCAAALVATALQQGRISREELSRLAGTASPAASESQSPLAPLSQSPLS